MNKIWYLDIEGVEEGPFTTDEIILHPRVTLDTLIWKEGMSSWLPVRKIPELKGFFKATTRGDDHFDDDRKGEENNPYQEDELADELTGVHESLALDMKKDPDYFIYIVIIIAVLTLYLIFNNIT